MKQEIVRITDCNRCSFRMAETDEYPSDFCTISGHPLSQHTSFTHYGECITPPDSCPLRKKDHIVKINRCYTLRDE